jgi:hypothetical protein
MPDPVIDSSVAHPARRYNYWLGGTDNFPADRESGDEFERRFPGMRAGVRANRAFLKRAVQFLAAEAGIRQFLDLGTGLPSADNTHEVAQGIAPSSRVVYADNDPLVLRHARALLTSTPEGATRYLDRDLRDPAAILADPQLREILDLTRPVALMLIAVLHFIPGDGAARLLVDELLSALPPGSFLALTHGTHDFAPDQAATHQGMVDRGRSDFWTRDKAEITSLFDGLEILAPGVVPCSEWRPTPDDPKLDPRVVWTYAAVGRKP